MSDEIGCPPKYPGGRYCPETRFQCNNNFCVFNTDVCDGSDDCGDNSDEAPSVCSTLTCDATRKFQCDNKRCIPKFQIW